MNVKEVLQVHQTNLLYEDQTNVFRITVRRSNIWEDAVRAMKRSFDEKRHLRVTFLGESAVDGGGPRREFFMLLMNSIKDNNSLLDGPSNRRVLRHNTPALQEEMYLCMGKMIALSVVHGGPGPSFFAESVVAYLFCGLSGVTAKVDDVPDTSIRDQLKKV